MLRSLLSAFPILLAACGPACAQDLHASPANFAGSTCVERLPPVGPVFVRAGEHLAESVGDVTTEAEPPPKPWEGSVEIGVNGTEGNTQTFNVLAGFDVRRKTDLDVFSLDLDYRKNNDDGDETAHRAFLDGRWELLYEQSPATSFFHATVDYDEFQAFDVRVTYDSGFGLKLIETEFTLFQARFGGGFSREIGGPDDRVVPEAVLGLDFEHRLGRRHKLTASVEYAPDVQYFTRFRLNGQANWELLIDEEMNLSLKFGVLDRYDSTPNGVEPNDLDYSAVLLWGF